MNNYTYILECGDGSYYCGWTNDLQTRIRCHESGRGGRYTRSHLPVKLVYYEVYDNRRDAMRREYRIKQLSRAEKAELIQHYKDGYTYLGGYSQKTV